MTIAPTEHLFHPLLKKHAYDLGSFSAALAHISHDRIDAYMKAIPAEWDESGDIRKDIASYLKDLTVNSDGLCAEVGSVLK
jgi:hypothetical protein